MLIRYIDGPWAGTTVETNLLSVIGTQDIGDGLVQQVTYAVDREARTARFVEWGPIWNAQTGEGYVPLVPDTDGHAVPPVLLSEASTAEIVAELGRRGFRQALSTPMRRRRRDMPRAGFGQRWPSE